MKVIKLFFLIALVLVDIAAFSQDSTYVLTLAQAREYALEHNRTLLNAKDQVTSAEQKKWETLAGGLPQVSGSLDYKYYFNYEMNFGGSGGSTTQPTGDPLVDTLLKKIGEGMAQAFATEPMKNVLTGNIQVSQLIFSGQFISGIQIAEIAHNLAEQNVSLTELDVKENVTNTYYSILANENTLRIIGENLKNLEGIMQHTQNMYMAGIMEATDVDQIKITVSQIKNTQQMLQRMQQLSYNMMKFQLGVPVETEISLADSLEQILTFSNSQAVEQPGYDISNNLNYQIMDSQVSLTKKQVDLQNWAYAPTVAGFYMYTQKLITSGFDMQPPHLAGVTVSVPIFSSGMRYAKVSQAKIDLDIAQRNQEMVKDQLTLQENQLLYNYQSALENYNTQKENVEVANRVYKSIQNKFQQGMASSLDLTQANSNFLTAESNYVTSVLTLLQAQTSLQKLYNTL
jgi:outer membrane protein